MFVVNTSQAQGPPGTVSYGKSNPDFHSDSFSDSCLCRFFDFGFQKKK